MKYKVVLELELDSAPADSNPAAVSATSLGSIEVQLVNIGDPITGKNLASLKVEELAGVITRWQINVENLGTGEDEVMGRRGPGLSPGSVPEPSPEFVPLGTEMGPMQGKSPSQELGDLLSQ